MFPAKMTQQDHIRAVLKDTIVLLCQNDLHFQSELSVEALVAITVDQNEVVLVSIRETVAANNKNACHSHMHTESPEQSVSNSATNFELISTSSASVARETDIVVCHKQECGNSVDIPEGLPGSSVENDGDSYVPVKPASDVGLTSLTSSTQNCSSCDEPATVTSEALDLTGYMSKRANPAPKRRRKMSIGADAGQLSVIADDMDSCSETSSVVCVKDEFHRALADLVNSEQSSSSHCTYVPADANHAGKHGYQNAFSSVADASRTDMDVSTIAARSAAANEASLHVDMHSVCQAIMAYSGWCVPLRDIQRLRLRGMQSAVIRSAMDMLERSGLGRCCEVTGNMCVFYKCPPHLVTADALARWRLTWKDYSIQFASLPALNQTNRHNDSYWQRVASSSPYNYI